MSNFIKTAIASVALVGLVIVGIMSVSPKDPAEYVFRKVADGVVLVSVTDGDPENPMGGLGTGFFIDKNLIMTNYHVIEGGNDIEVYAHNSIIPYKASVIASSEPHDVALIKINEYDAFVKQYSPVIMGFADYEPLQGQKVFAIGHPSGFDWTISEGIVSGLNRTVDGPKTFIQTDTSIHPGNSGGPLLDESGKVLGMNTAIIEVKGGSYGFAIDKRYLKKVFHDLIKYGKSELVRAGLVLELTDDKKSVRVESVMSGGAAESCGFQAKDIIEQVKTQNDTMYLKMDNIVNLVMKFNELNMDQTEVSFVIRRDGEIMRKDCALQLKDA